MTTDSDDMPRVSVMYSVPGQVMSNAFEIAEVDLITIVHAHGLEHGDVHKMLENVLSDLHERLTEPEPFWPTSQPVGH